MLRAMPIGYWATSHSQSFFVTISGRLPVHIRSKLKPNQSNAQYILQLNPIFAVTGIFRIFITYGFWQGVRNGHPENQKFFGDDHLIMNFINDEGDLASWFNLCGLVWFFSGHALKTISRSRSAVRSALVTLKIVRLNNLEQLF